MMYNIASQFSRFIVVGVLSTILNYGAFFVLHRWLSSHYLVASAAGYIVGLILGYLLNSWWAFKQPGSAWLYGTVYTTSLLTSLGVLHVLVQWLNLMPLLANVLAIGVSTVMNFVGLKLVVFRK